MQACSSRIGCCHYGAEAGDAISSVPTHVTPLQKGLTGKLLHRRLPWLGGLLASALVLAVTACAPSTVGSADASAKTSDVTEYVIGAGDRLGIFVYDNPQLSIADLPVRPDGRISMPLVSDVTAAGQTPAQLSKVLTERLRKYVKEPNVTVMLHDFIGPFNRQIRVIGEAAEPQAIAYREHMTLLDVVISTKGLTRFAAGNSAVIVRDVPGKGSTKLRVHLSDLIKDGDISQNVEMQPGDTLIIPQTLF